MANQNQPQRIWLSPPHLGDEERRLVNEAIDSNWIAPLGPMVDRFEQELSSYLGLKHALAASSGTAALHLALRHLNFERGTPVFCSSLTFVGSANPILYEGGVPVFIDSEPTSWNISSKALARALEQAQKNKKLPAAVIVVNLYGQSADMDQILQICNQYKVPVIEDAAESLGATYKGRPSGCFGKYSILSFNGNKIITTSGGGMLLSNDAAMIEKARYWATQARDPAAHYQHTEIGFNYRMSNLLAALGIGQFHVLADRVAARRKIFESYKRELSTLPGVGFMPEADFGVSTRWLSVMTLDPAKTKVIPMDIVNILAQQNIEARPVWKPLHAQPLFKDAAYFEHEQGFSFSDEAFRRGVCLPSGSSLDPTSQQRVIDKLREVLG